MIDKLEFFIALASEQHFGRAAEECGVTQPTLSAAIKQLEDQLGVMLVQRGSRFQGLTPEGQQVLEWARRIVGDARTMREEMRAARHGLSGRIRIAAIPTALAMVPRLTTPFREKHPGVTFSILSRTSIEVLSLLGNFEIDAGITYLDNEPLGRVTSVPLYAERYQLITAAGTTLSDRDKVTWAEVSHAAALPADAGHAEPAHHRPASGRGRRAGAADARIELDDRAVLPHPDRQMVVDHAAQPRARPSALPSRSGPSRSSSRMPATPSAWWRRSANRTRRWSRRCWTRRWRWRTISTASAELGYPDHRTRSIENFYQSTRQRY